MAQHQQQLSGITRRGALTALAAGAAGAMAAGQAQAAPETQDGPLQVRNGRIKQSVSQWCYGKIPLGDFCAAIKAMGLPAIDLLNVDQLDIPKQHGLVCSMVNGPGPIHKGWNEPRNHDELIAGAQDLIPKIAAQGMPNMIVFSGNRRRNQTDEEGLKHAAEGLKQIAPLAEEHGVTLILELLNSKRDHKGYMADNTPWAMELVDAVGSENFKLLYDIYHMQIMEGDVIQTIRDHHAYFGHYHTGGVPGRHEIDETQELYYPAICEAIVETGFTGYLSHEFVPAREPLESLAQAVRICDV